MSNADRNALGPIALLPQRAGVRGATFATIILAGIAPLTGCNDADVTAADVEVPRALIEPFPADVGLYYADDLRNYVHSEERWGGKWQVKLGDTHVRMLDKLMKMAFRRTVAVKGPKAEPADANIGAILRPTIEQYSFVTPRDTGGSYYAVTIKYRLEVFAPDGRPADSIGFTGYGSAPAGGGLSGGDEPMIQATRMAMRDAAAKFLVQFPDLPVAQRLRAGEPLVQVAEATPAAASEQTTDAQAVESEEVKIEAVPIVDAAVH